MIFPFGHLGHALHTLKDLLDGGGEGGTAAKTPEAARAEQRSELEGRIAAMNLPPEIRGQIVALIQTGDLHAARQAIRAASIRPPAPLPEVRRPAPTSTRSANRDRGQDRSRGQGGGFGF